MRIIVFVLIFLASSFLVAGESPRQILKNLKYIEARKIFHLNKMKKDNKSQEEIDKMEKNLLDLRKLIQDFKS